MDKMTRMGRHLKFRHNIIISNEPWLILLRDQQFAALATQCLDINPIEHTGAILDKSIISPARDLFHVLNADLPYFLEEKI